MFKYSIKKLIHFKTISIFLLLTLVISQLFMTAGSLLIGTAIVDIIDGQTERGTINVSVYGGTFGLIIILATMTLVLMINLYKQNSYEDLLQSRIIGASTKQLISSLVFEVLLLCFIALIASFPLSLPLAKFINAQYINLEAIDASSIIRSSWFLYAISLGAILFFVLLPTFFAALSLRKITLGESKKRKLRSFFKKFSQIFTGIVFLAGAFFLVIFNFRNPGLQVGMNVCSLLCLLIGLPLVGRYWLGLFFRFCNLVFKKIFMLNNVFMFLKSKSGTLVTLYLILFTTFFLVFYTQNADYLMSHVTKSLPDDYDPATASTQAGTTIMEFVTWIIIIFALVALLASFVIQFLFMKPLFQNLFFNGQSKNQIVSFYILQMLFLIFYALISAIAFNILIFLFFTKSYHEEMIWTNSQMKFWLMSCATFASSAILPIAIGLILKPKMIKF